jgi:hypothetical protein
MAEHREKTSTRRERNDRRDEHRRHQHRRKQNVTVDEERRVMVDQRGGYQRKGHRRSGRDRREDEKKGQ